MVLSVVIPAYNEGRSIATTIRETFDFFTSYPELVMEVLVVNDGSTDDTGAVVRGLVAQYDGLRLLCNEGNRGKGFSVRRGALESRGEYILFMDADLSTPLSQFEKIWPVAKKYDIVIGSRALESSRIIVRQSFAKRYAGKLGNYIIRTLLGLPFRDTQCGFKIFSGKAREVFKRQTIQRWGFDFELLFIARRHYLQCVEIAVEWRNDPTSAVRGRDYWRTLAEVFTVLVNDFNGRYVK